MRTLFLSYEFPFPEDKGDRIYTGQLLKQLVNNKNYVHLVVFERKAEARSDPSVDLNSECSIDTSAAWYASRLTVVPFKAKGHVRAFFSLKPGMIANRFSGQYIKTVLSILRKEASFDVVLVNHFKLAYLVEMLKPHLGTTKIAIITHNAEGPLSKTVFYNMKNPIKKFAYYLDWIKTRKYEIRLLLKYHGVTAIAPKDYNCFTRDYGLKNVSLLVPGIELEQYPSEFPAFGKDNCVIVSGSFLWDIKKTNLLYLLNCQKFPLLYKRGIMLKIVGNADPCFVKRVNTKYQGVEMTGRVPDVRLYYEGCSIALVPELMGGGFKLKLLEAAALKRAQIVMQGAINAPGFEKETHYIEAENFRDMIEKTIQLMSNPEKMTRMSRNAYNLVQSEYSWECVYGKFMTFLERLN